MPLYWPCSAYLPHWLSITHWAIKTSSSTSSRTSRWPVACCRSWLSVPVASASTLAVVEPVSRSPLSRQDQASCQKDLTNWLPTVIPNLDWQRDTALASPATQVRD
ncbi:hypothetical protein EMIT0P44_140137 [Pseudomonas sp. IT-P44]